METNTKPGELRTREGKHTMTEWWELSEAAERPNIPLFRNFMGPDDLVFDIGANRGRKTWIFRQLGARVIAVEPLAKFFQEWVPELYWKFAKDPGVTIIAAAIDKSALNVPFWIQKNIPYLSSMNGPWRTKSAHRTYYNDVNSELVNVPAITLDSLMENHGRPVFIKCDVEGNENQTMTTLSRPVLAFNMEFHEDWIPSVAIKHMARLAKYEWNFTLDFRPQFVLPEWTNHVKMLQYMRDTLTKKGPGSWGDLYGRVRDHSWNF